MSFNSKGFSLMEIMVAIALVGVIGLGVSSLSYNMVKASTTAEDSQEISSLKYEIDGILNNPTYCSSIVNPQGIPSADGSPLQLGPNIAAGQHYGSLSIVTVNLENVIDVSGSGTLYHADVVIKGQKREVNYGAKDFTIRSGIFYDLIAGKVNSCVGSQTSGASCAALGGSMVAGKCNFCTALGGTLVAGVCNLGGGPTTTTSTTLPPACLPAGTILGAASGPVVPCSQWNGPALCDQACVNAFNANALCSPVISNPVLCGAAWNACTAMPLPPVVCCNGFTYNSGNIVCN